MLVGKKYTPEWISGINLIPERNIQKIHRIGLPLFETGYLKRQTTSSTATRDLKDLIEKNGN
jgi:hypothetical protein